MFVGYKLHKDKSITFSSGDLKVLSINQITLGSISDETKNVNVFVESKSEAYKWCSLAVDKREIYDCKLHLLLKNKNDKYIFKLKSKAEAAAVNLLGMVEFEEGENNSEKDVGLNIAEENIRKNVVNKGKDRGKSVKEDVGSSSKEDVIDNEDKNPIRLDELLRRKRKENPMEFRPFILGGVNKGKKIIQGKM